MNGTEHQYQPWGSVVLPEPVARQMVHVCQAISRLDESIDRLLAALDAADVSGEDAVDAEPMEYA